MAYRLLRQLILGKYETLTEYCRETGKDSRAFLRKMKGVGQFTADEVFTISDEFKIEPEYMRSFFTKNVAQDAKQEG